MDPEILAAAPVAPPSASGPPAPPGASLPVRVASTPGARLRGLLGHRVPPEFALRLDRCRCVHTVGMRFALDLHWLDGDGAVIRVDRGVGPWRFRSCRRARAVVEVPVGASILGRP
jgi:uncharacterized protein